MNTPVPHAQSIRIYASGRQFVVVPLVPGPDGLPVEVAPIHPVYLRGVTAIVLVICGAFLVGVTPRGFVIEEALARVGRALEPLY